VTPTSAADDRHRLSPADRAVSAVALGPGLFTEGDSPALIGGRCAACSHFHFPFSPVCPYCSEGGTERVELSREGELWAWTAVTAAPPGYLGDVPYGFGVVELPEGIRVVSRLTEADPSRLVAGQPMSLVLVPVAGGEGEEMLTFAFAPRAL
jgi:uncharacterized protein